MLGYKYSNMRAEAAHVILNFESDTNYRHSKKIGSVDPSEPAGQCVDDKLRLMYFRVILRAIQDCSGAVCSTLKAEEKKEAEHWLSHESEDLEFVCQIAGVDMQWLLKAIKPMLGDTYKLRLLYKRIKTLLCDLDK